MPGTDLANGALSLRAPYAMPGTDRANGALSLRHVRYDLVYGFYLSTRALRHVRRISAAPRSDDRSSSSARGSSAAAVGALASSALA
eukprot:3445350-Rhodomonas_salina.1